MTRPAWTVVCLLTSFAAMTVAGDGSAVTQDTPTARTDASGDPLPDGALARLGTLRWCHPQPVTFVAFLPDGRGVLTGSDDRVFRLWDRASGKEIRRFVVPPTPPTVKGPRFPRFAVVGALSVDGKTLTAAADKKIYFWDVETGKIIRQLEAPNLNRPTSDVVKALIFAPDGKSLAVRSIDETIHLIAADTGEPVGQLRDQPEKAFGPILVNEAGPTVAFSPDGKRLASKEIDGKPANGKRFLRVRDIATGKELWRVDFLKPVSIAVAYAPNGKFVAAATAGAIQLLDADSGQLVREIDNAFMCQSLLFSPDSKYLLGTLFASEFVVWAVDSGEEVHRFGKRPLAGGGGVLLQDANRGPAVSADGKTLMAAVGNTVRMWDLGTGKEVPLAGGSRGAVTAVTVFGDGKRAISRGSDNIFRVWDLADGRELRQFSEPDRTRSVAFAPDRQSLACGGIGGEITIVNATTGQPLTRFKTKMNSTGALVYSPDGNLLASLGAFATAIQLHDVATGAVRQSIALPLPAASGVGDGLSLAFSPDGKTLIGHFPANNGAVRIALKAKVANAGGTATLRVWDVATGEERRKLDLTAPLGNSSMALAPDARVLACENSDSTVSAWELASGKERVRFGKAEFADARPLEKAPFLAGKKGGNGIQSRTAAHTVVFSPDGRMAAFKSPANSVRVWDVDAGTELGAFSHDGDITTLAFTPDSRRLVTGSTDTTLLVWDVARLLRPAPLPKLDLSAKEQSELWSDLAGDDAGKAFTAIRRLAASPQQSVPLLREKIKPAVPVEPKKLERLVAQLSNDDFEERNGATEELTRLGDLAVPALQKVVAGQETLETRRRVEALLLRLTTGGLLPEPMRVVRAVEVLERVGTPEARQALQSLANGAPAALVTREAQAALDRSR